MFEKQINAQKLKLKSNRAEYYPRVDLDATYSDKDSDKITSLDVRQATAGVYVKWDLYTGDSTEINKMHRMIPVHFFFNRNHVRFIWICSNWSYLNTSKETH